MRVVHVCFQLSVMCLTIYSIKPVVILLVVVLVVVVLVVVALFYHT